MFEFAVTLEVAEANELRPEFGGTCTVPVRAPEPVNEVIHDCPDENTV